MEEATHALNISAGLLGYAAEFVSKEETRYYLNGVFVEPAAEGVVAVATDGHRLVCIHDPSGHIERAAILRAPAPFLAKCRRHATKMLTMGALNPREIATLHIGACSEYAVVEEIDGTFPDWRMAIPKKFPAGASPPIILQARYLGAFEALSKGAGVRVYANGDAPALVLSAGSSSLPWMGVVMPMRSNSAPESGYPEWAGIARGAAKRRAA